MTEHIKLIKAKELKIGDEFLGEGCFWEVKDIEQKETSITVSYQVRNLIMDALWRNDDLLAIKTHCQNEDATNPSHYTQGEYEVIDILQDKLTPEQFEGFLIGNTFKYMFRERHKKRNRRC